MRKVFDIFRIRRDERWSALIVSLVFIVLNAFMIAGYFNTFSVIHDNYHWLFVNTFHISGFDPITYEVLSKWTTPYEIYRHPLLPFFWYIPYLINQGLMWLIGINCAQFIVAIVSLFCTLYSFIFLYRMFCEVVGVHRKDAILLTTFTFSFAYVIVATIVPDHFILSMFMLILTLYVSGKKMIKHKKFTKWQTVLFFIITAGISLSNGIKVFLANLFTNGKYFFKPLNLLLAIIIPVIAIWGFIQYEKVTFKDPMVIAKQLAKKRAELTHEKQVYKAFRDTTSLTDTTKIELAVNAILQAETDKEALVYKRSAVGQHIGKPIIKKGFLSWSDATTPRGATIIHNLFGESIILHRSHLLEDTLVSRPVIVKYDNIFNYIVEAIVVLLFAIGIWCGRRSKFLWLAMSFFIFDMALHMGLGFGIDEVYIMSPHWMFLYTIAIAYLFKTLREQWLNVLRGLVMCLTAYLLIYNVSLIVDYLV